ncbi:hypothetical protein LF1_52090 [Rubripirellula obstinata]|uniref:Uncharacterized protein n=1 Tax=Rubripirellula obstinata TaxID=406547 RepID=A0A5B1CCN4_9BACT|nr:hypothetical protein LF1_52090 [Rubripirellula obstinata]
MLDGALVHRLECSVGISAKASSGIAVSKRTVCRRWDALKKWKKIPSATYRSFAGGGAGKNVQVHNSEAGEAVLGRVDSSRTVKRWSGKAG